MTIPAHLKHRIDQLFDRMDRAYDAAARQSGFACAGCENNCCLTRFYHHTLLEHLYLLEGMAALPLDQQDKIRQQAAAVVEQAAAMERRNQTVRMMCPLNREGRCVLYAHRPMICRLHGIPHALRRPDGRVLTSPGCDDYDAQCGPSEKARLDRTPLYAAMAQVERELRQALGFEGKMKMTIAEMILDDRMAVLSDQTEVL